MHKTINKTAIQRLLGILTVWMLLVGCNSQPIPEARDFPLEMKRRILEVQAAVSKDPATAKTQIEILVENLDEADNEQLGEHKATVDQIKSIAKELQGIYGSSAGTSQAAPKLKEMAELANKLPGEVQPRDAASSKVGRDY